MVPLVFKTSLGVVRPPEGSTPSLLRHFGTRARPHAHKFRQRATPAIAAGVNSRSPHP